MSGITGTTAAAPFEQFDPPEGAESPLIVEVPHASVVVPEALVPPLLAPREALERDADLFVDRLFADAPRLGATLLVGRVSRYVVDLNRGEEDVDAEAVEGALGRLRAPRGVIWRLTGDGAPVLPRPLTQREFEARLDAFHRPYHARLSALIAARVARFGVAVVLAAHSMPSNGRLANGQPGPPRADVVPGTRGRTSAGPAFIACVSDHAMAHGLSVRHDDPYRGGFTTAHYGRPADRVHAVQVELARRLYMDEVTFTPSPRFDGLRTWCRGLVEKLTTAATR